MGFFKDLERMRVLGTWGNGDLGPGLMIIQDLAKGLMALPLHQRQDRIPRITHRLHGHIDKKQFYSFSHLKETVIRDTL